MDPGVFLGTDGFPQKNYSFIHTQESGNLTNAITDTKTQDVSWTLTETIKPVNKTLGERSSGSGLRFPFGDLTPKHNL